MSTLVEQQREAVVREALSWLGTPYCHEARVKGVGVDCGQLLIGVYSNAGIITAFDVPSYPPDWHLHRSESRFNDIVLRYCRRVLSPLSADVVTFRFGRTHAHGGIIVDDEANFVHAHAASQKVTLANVFSLEYVGRDPRYYRVKSCPE